jgi:hypothetical protein
VWFHARAELLISFYPWSLLFPPLGSAGIKGK